MATSQALPYTEQTRSRNNLIMQLYLGLRLIGALALLLFLGFLYLQKFAPENMLLDISISNPTYRSIADNLEFPELAITAVITLIELVFIISLLMNRLWGYAGLMSILALNALNSLVSFNSISAFIGVIISMAIIWGLVKYTDVYLE